MVRDEQLKERWEQVVAKLSARFADGERLDLDAIIYLIGVQELGKPGKRFKKDDKINLMHIAICRLLEPFGFYRFDYQDEDGWPHFKVLKADYIKGVDAQETLLKHKIIQYFKER